MSQLEYVVADVGDTFDTWIRDTSPAPACAAGASATAVAAKPSDMAIAATTATTRAKNARGAREDDRARDIDEDVVMNGSYGLFGFVARRGYTCTQNWEHVYPRAPT